MQIENRGTSDQPFGFVYADEDTRGYFAITGGTEHGPTLRIGGPGSRYWKPLSLAQARQAQALLMRTFGLIEA